jgi:hypothetical protein
LLLLVLVTAGAGSGAALESENGLTVWSVVVVMIAGAEALIVASELRLEPGADAGAGEVDEEAART